MKDKEKSSKIEQKNKNKDEVTKKIRKIGKNRRKKMKNSKEIIYKKSGKRIETNSKKNLRKIV